MLLTKRQYTNAKTKLTKAQRSGDPQRVLDVCEEAFDLFNDHVYPDDWHRWRMAEYDAIVDINSASDYLTPATSRDGRTTTELFMMNANR